MYGKEYIDWLELVPSPKAIDGFLRSMRPSPRDYFAGDLIPELDAMDPRTRVCSWSRHEWAELNASVSGHIE